MLVITITPMIKPIRWTNLFGNNKPPLLIPHYPQILGGALRCHLVSQPYPPGSPVSPEPSDAGFLPAATARGREARGRTLGQGGRGALRRAGGFPHVQSRRRHGGPAALPSPRQARKPRALHNGMT